MTRPTSARRLGAALRLLATTALVGGSALHGTAWAQANPYFIGASQAFSHDSNVFRVDKRFGPISDTISATSLFAGIEQPWGRQRLFANVGLEYNAYNRLSRLDFLGTDLGFGLDWATVHRLTGSLRYTRKEGQGDYSRPGAATTRGKNVQETQRAEATVNYELTPRLALVGGLEYREINVDNRAYASSEVAGQVARLGVSYSVSPLLTVGTGVRYTEDRRGSAIQIGVDQFTPQNTHTTDLDLTANWTPATRINLNGRLSFGNEKQSQRDSRSSSRVTGSLGLNYTPTSRLAFDASVSRDTGTETTFRTSPTSPTAPTSPAPGGGGPRGFFVDSNRLTTTYLLGARYAVTSKIGLTASYDRSQGAYQNPNGRDEDNNTDRYSLGAQYAALNNLVFGCAVRRETRSGSGAATVNSGVQAFVSNSVNCNVRYMIR